MSQSKERWTFSLEIVHAFQQFWFSMLSVVHTDTQHKGQLCPIWLASVRFYIARTCELLQVSLIALI